jgi:hypothetical protein
MRCSTQKRIYARERTIAGGPAARATTWTAESDNKHCGFIENSHSNEKNSRRRRLTRQDSTGILLMRKELMNPFFKW